MTKKAKDDKPYLKDKVMIAVPSPSVIHADMGMSLAAVANHSTSVGIRIALNNYKGNDSAYAKNHQVIAAMQSGATHILFMASDVVFPPWTVQRLLDRMKTLKKKIIGVTSTKPSHPFTQTATDVDGKKLKIEMDNGRGVEEVSTMTCDLVLIDMKVFRKLDFPWFATEFDIKHGAPFDEMLQSFINEDEYFFNSVSEARIQMYVDIAMSMDVQKLGQVRFDYTSQDFFADAVSLRGQKAQEMMNGALKPITEPDSQPLKVVKEVPLSEASNGK